MESRIKGRPFFRIAAVLLAVTLAFACVFTGAVSGAGSDTVAEDDFSGNLSKWGNASAGRVLNGVYRLSAGELNWFDVGPQTGVMMRARVTIATARGADTMASVFVAANKTLTSGYEFGVGISKAGIPFARLYRRGDVSSEQMLYQINANIPGADSGKIVNGGTYEITVGAADGVIRCLINGALVCEINDSACKTGYAGLRSSGVTNRFDDALLSKIPERKVRSLKIVGMPSEVARYSRLSFGIEADYGGYWGKETLKSSDAGVVVYPRDVTASAGVKNVYVEYGGARSESVPLTVTATFASRQLFSANFDSWAAVESYVNDPHNPDKGTAKLDYHWEVRDNALYAVYPKNETESNAHLLGWVGTRFAAPGTAYEVDLTCAVVSNSTSSSGEKTRVGFTFVKDTATGAEYQVLMDESGAFTASGPNGALGIGSANISRLKKNAKITLGRDFKLRCLLYDGIGCIYYTCGSDDILLTVFPFDMASTTPHIRLRTYAGTARFVNITAKTVLERDPGLTAKSFRLLTYAGKALTRVMGRTFSLDGTYVAVTFSDGSVGYYNAADVLTVSGYKEKKSGKITLSLGAIKTTVDFKYVDALFYDDFATGLSPAITPDTSDSFELDDSGGRVGITYKSTLAGNPYQITVTGGENWTDYTVSADVRPSALNTSKGHATHFGVVCRRRDANNLYWFRLTYTPSEQLTGVLVKRVNGAYETLATFSRYQLAKNNEGKVPGNGNEYNISLTCRGNSFYMYFNGQLLGAYTDTSPTAILTGGAGLFAMSWTGNFDNLKVTDEMAGKWTGGTVSGAENNTLKVYEGGEIEPYGLRVNMKNSKGGTLSVPLTVENFSPFDNLKLGVQNITISLPAYGYSLTAKVKVVKRRDVISALSSDLEKLDPGEITEKSEDDLKKLQSRYDELTPYEASLLSEKGRGNLKDANVALDKIKYPKEAEASKELVTYETMETPGVWREQTGDISDAYWFLRNGYLAEDQASYSGLWGTARQQHTDYAKGVSVSADVMILGQMTDVGVFLNQDYTGDYYAVALVEDVENETFSFQLRRTGTVVNSVMMDALRIDVPRNEWINLRLSYIDGVLYGYYNGRLVLDYDENNANVFTHFDDGRSGVWGRGNDIRFDNYRLYGEKTEDPGDPPVEPVNYDDDFEDEKAGARPSHWIEPGDTSTGMRHDYNVYNKFGSKVYGTNSASGSTSSYLHVFDRETTMEADLYTGGHAANGEVGFSFRQSPAQTYIHVGYSYEKGKWYVKQEMWDLSEPSVIWADKATPLSENTKHRIKAVFTLNGLAFTVDGKTVFDLSAGITCDGYGRIGVYTENSQLYIDNVSLVLTSGNLPEDGVLEYDMNYDDYVVNNPSVHMIDMGGGKIIGFAQHFSDVYMSEDYGTTWRNIGTAHDGTGEAAQFIDLLQINYHNAIKMANGKYLYIQDQTCKVYESLDMVNWKYKNTIPMPEGFYNTTQKPYGVQDGMWTDESNRALYGSHIDSMLQFKLSNGKTRILYPIEAWGYATATATDSGSGNCKTLVAITDDFGESWHFAKDDSSVFALDYEDNQHRGSWGESKFLHFADGTIRWYSTRQSGNYLMYSESRDGGETWSGFYPIPEIQRSVSSFSIKEDPYNPGTYYTVWVNDRQATFQTRRRFSLAVSNDGVHWNFVTDIERFVFRASTNKNYQAPVFQIIDPDLIITKDYILITHLQSIGLPEGEPNSGLFAAHGVQEQHYTRIEKSRLKAPAKEWNASNLGDPNLPKSVELVGEPTLKVGLGDVFSLAGREVRYTDFLGNTFTRDLRSFSYREDDKPNVLEKGTQQLLVFDNNFMQLNLNIEVVDSYRVTWQTKGKGTIEPRPTKVLDGDDLTFALTPNRGYVVERVTVNGKEIEERDGKYTYPDVHEALTVRVEFAVDDLGEVIADVVSRNRTPIIVGIIVGVVVIVLAVLFFVFKLYKKESWRKIGAKLRGKKPEIESVSGGGTEDGQNGGSGRS